MKHVHHARWRALVAHYCKSSACLGCNTTSSIASGLDCASLRLARLWPVDRRARKSVFLWVSYKMRSQSVLQPRLGLLQLQWPAMKGSTLPQILFLHSQNCATNILERQKWNEKWSCIMVDCCSLQVVWCNAQMQPGRSLLQLACIAAAPLAGVASLKHPATLVHIGCSP